MSGADGRTTNSTALNTPFYIIILYLHSATLKPPCEHKALVMSIPRLCGRSLCYYCCSNAVSTQQGGSRERCCRDCYTQHCAVVERHPQEDVANTPDTPFSPLPQPGRTMPNSAGDRTWGTHLHTCTHTGIMICLASAHVHSHTYIDPLTKLITYFT